MTERPLALADEPFPEDEAPGLIALPGFLTGGRVERTGIALVHEGEYIQPAPGSEAVITPLDANVGGEQVVNVYFPLEIEVIGGLSEADLRQVTQAVFAELDAAFQSRR